MPLSSMALVSDGIECSVLQFCFSSKETKSIERGHSLMNIITAVLSICLCSQMQHRHINLRRSARSPEIKPLAIRRPASASPISKPSRGRRPLPDAPISAKSTLSIYSPDVRICTLQPHQSTEALISCRRRAVSRLCLLWSLRGQQEAILCVNSFRCRFAKPSSATGLSLNHRMIEMLVSRTLVLRPIS